VSAPWTEAHRREAIRRIYELAAELSAENLCGAESMAKRALWYSEAAALWSAFLGSWFDADRVKREVRRLRGLAEGRLVRERAMTYRNKGGRHVCVRITRVRRAP
jgi:hypothetical protein